MGDIFASRRKAVEKLVKMGLKTELIYNVAKPIPAGKDETPRYVHHRISNGHWLIQTIETLVPQPLLNAGPGRYLGKLTDLERTRDPLDISRVFPASLVGSKMEFDGDFGRRFLLESTGSGPDWYRTNGSRARLYLNSEYVSLLETATEGEWRREADDEKPPFLVSLDHDQIPHLEGLLMPMRGPKGDHTQPASFLGESIAA